MKKVCRLWAARRSGDCPPKLQDRSKGHAVSSSACLRLHQGKLAAVQNPTQGSGLLPARTHGNPTRLSEGTYMPECITTMLRGAACCCCRAAAGGGAAGCNTAACCCHGLDAAGRAAAALNGACEATSIASQDVRGWRRAVGRGSNGVSHAREAEAACSALSSITKRHKRVDRAGEDEGTPSMLPPAATWAAAALLAQ